MKNRSRFLMKNGHSVIALCVLMAMMFNACPNPAGSAAGDFTPVYFYVDSSGEFTETDSGRTVLVADENAKVVFYSDDIESSAQHVGFAFDDKTIIFFFDEDRNFPTGIVFSDPEETFTGILTPYDPDTQTYGITFEQDGEQEIMSDIPLSGNVFTRYTDDPDLSPGQNLRMRNLYIAMCIYMSLDDFIAVDDTNARGIGGWFTKIILKPFLPAPALSIVAGVVDVVVGTVSIYTGGIAGTGYVFGPLSIRDGIIDIIDGIKGIEGPPVIAPTAPPVTTVSVTGVSLNRTSASIGIGSTLTLSPAITPANATNKTVNWSSSDTAVATVSNGTVTGRSAGTATVTVTTADGGKTDSCTVTVSPVPVTGVSLNKAATAMLVNGTETLIAEVKPTNAADKNVTWSSSDTTIATVSTNGTVTGRSAGSATITVTTVDGGYTDSCTVTVSSSVVNVTGVSLDKPSAYIGVGSTLTLNPTITPTSATNQNVTWSSSDTAVAMVSDTGEVTGMSVGTTTVTVSSVDGNKTASCTVTVVYMVMGTDIASKLAWLQTNAQSNGNYLIELDADTSIAPQTLSYGGKNVTITIEGYGGERTLTLSTNGNMFLIDSGVTLILDNNIRLRGKNDNKGNLVVSVRAGGTLVMNEGATIYGNSNTGTGGGGGVWVDGTFTMNGGTISNNSSTGDGGGVYVNKGTFTMNGGTISNNNTKDSGGGVAMNTNTGGTFTMTGGTIFNNTASARGGGVFVFIGGTFTMTDGTISSNDANDGGGVRVSGGTFKMTGGTISNNEAKSYGGGVSLTNNHSFGFTKTGGTIYGYTAGDSNSNVVQSAVGVVQNNKGHAVYNDLWSNKRKETTAGPTVNLSVSYSLNKSPVYGGAWD